MNDVVDDNDDAFSSTRNMFSEYGIEHVFNFKSFHSFYAKCWYFSMQMVIRDSLRVQFATICTFPLSDVKSI